LFRAKSLTDPSPKRGTPVGGGIEGRREKGRDTHRARKEKGGWEREGERERERERERRGGAGRTCSREKKRIGPASHEASQMAMSPAANLSPAKRVISRFKFGCQQHIRQGALRGGRQRQLHERSKAPASKNRLQALSSQTTVHATCMQCQSCAESGLAGCQDSTKQGFPGTGALQPCACQVQWGGGRGGHRFIGHKATLAMRCPSSLSHPANTTMGS
jgi:hypothetical protein